MPKRMNSVGNGALRHVHGFFFPVKEKPAIRAALDEALAQQNGHAHNGHEAEVPAVEEVVETETATVDAIADQSAE